MLENEKEGAKKFDNSELLRKANIDREEYFAELDKERQREQQKIVADKEFEERKQREILDLEDQVNALISKNRFFEKEMRSLLINGDEGDNQIIEKYKDNHECIIFVFHQMAIQSITNKEKVSPAEIVEYII